MKKKLEIDTNKDFRVLEFLDEHGQICVLSKGEFQESPALMLGVKKGVNTILLDRESAALLANALLGYAETGKLRFKE